MFTYMVFFCYREQIPDAQPRRKQLNVTSSLKDQKYAVKLIELSAIKKPAPVWTTPYRHRLELCNSLSAPESRLAVYQ
jgi:hypothetical protein